MTATRATTIWQVMPDDLPRMGKVAERFYASSKHLNGFDIERFTKFWFPLLENGMGTIFAVYDEEMEIVGAIGGMAYPEPYNGEMQAMEFFWFVQPEHRGVGMKLYRMFEEWARGRGCKRIRMAHLTDLMPEKVHRVYERLGFEQIEVHYSKELT